MAVRPGPYFHTLRFPNTVYNPSTIFRADLLKPWSTSTLKKSHVHYILVIGKKYKPRKLAALRVFCIALSRLIRCAAQSAVPRMSDQGHTLFTLPPCALSSVVGLTVT